MGKIGLGQLNDALIALLQNNAGAGIAIKKNNITITENTEKVQINIDLFNKDSDALLVFKNSVYLHQDVDYVINEDNTITPINEGRTWEASLYMPLDFNYICFRSVPADGIPINGEMIAPNSVSENKLTQELIEKINGEKGLSKEEIIEIIGQYGGTNESAIIALIQKYALDISAGVDIEMLKRMVNALTDNVMEIMIYLDLESESDVDETGIWFDPLKDESNIESKEGDVKVDTVGRRITGTQGSITFLPVEVSFNCDRVRYIHEADNNFVEVLSSSAAEMGTSDISITSSVFEIV